MVAHLFFIVIFCRSESPFFSSRAGFVRATLVRPHFEGLEHDGTFSAVGMTIEGSPLPGAVQSRHNLVSGRSEDPNHDAVMRIGSEAPKRRTHSSNRHESQGTCRKSATSNRHRCPSQAYEQGRNCRGAFSVPHSLCRTQNDAVRYNALPHEPPQGDEKLARQGHDHGLASTESVLSASSKPLR